MASLFSRNRTTSKATPPTSQHLSADIGYDDFGRVTSRGKDKDTGKKGKKDKERARTISDAGSRPVSEATPDIPDGVFLGTSLQPPPVQTPEGLEPYKVSEQPYGHLAAENHVILGLDDACRLVAVVAQELSERGLATPLLFSSSALDINPSMTRRLIAAFIRTCSSPQSQDGKWREEARFAGPHELAMVLRWGLARLVRMDKGQEVHGLLRWELYVSWRTHEHAASYDPNHFITLLPSVQPQIRMILTTLLDLLSRLIAHSASNGLTPPSLAALFGPLLFGLGSLTQGAFQLAYTMYLRSVNATEHIILNYIRYQEAQETVASILPARLKDWTRNYHGMIPAVDKLDRARVGSRTVRLASIRRNVRLYSPDLVKTSASWATRGDNSLANSKEWSKIVPPSHKLQPKYTDAFRKRMDLPPTFNPDLGPGASLSSSSSTVSTISSIGTLSPSSSEISSVSVVSDEHRFRSLTDMRWGEFESIGFSSGGNDKALEFDLTEGARKARDEKRGTMSWSDFSSEGFSRTDEPLSATLQFSAPLATQVIQWPSQNAELQRKLKKAQKSLPSFGWDTEPVLGAEEVIEESFLDCFCDLIYGGGWMERSEGTFRDCNWALVEFKSLPQQRPTLVPQGDPRTGSTLLLFEEFVPLEYRAQLSAPKKKMRFFLPASSKKQWKPAPTMNGRPYVVGTVNGAPRTPNNEKRNEFEDLLRTSAGVTKVLTIQDAFPTPLAIPKERNLSNLSINRSPDPAVTLPSPLPTPKAERKPLPQSAPATPASPINRTSPSQQPPLPAKTLATKTSLFNLSKNKRGGMMYDTAIDFEAHTESEGSSDEAPAPPSASKRPGAAAKDPSKRLSRDDAWVDILIGDNRRMDNQAAELRRPGAKAKTSPDAAREEIARALASVGQRPPDDDDIMPRIKPSFEMRPSTEEGDHNRRDSYPYPAPAIPRHSTDDEDDDDRYGAPEPRNPPVFRPPTVISMPSPESNDFEPLDEPEIPVSPPSSPPSMVLRSPAARPHPAGPRQPSLPVPRAESPQPSRSPSPSGRRPMPSTPEPAPKAVPPKGKTGGVSSLIEMYREREKGSPKKKDEAPAPSRLPVRAPTNTNNVGNGSSASSALSSNGLASNTQTAIPAVVTPLEEKAPYVAAPVKINALSPSSLAKTANNTPSKPTPTPAVPKTIPAPNIPDTGRTSPAPPRYVHGAPLHNVTEEEEED